MESVKRNYPVTGVTTDPDPARLINMTDEGCGSTCEKPTCITGG